MAPAWGEKPSGSPFRFGEWLLLVPGTVSEAELRNGPYIVHSQAKRAELFLIWQSGEQRAVVLRFDPRGEAPDAAVQRSYQVVETLKSCNSGVPSAIPSLRDIAPLWQDAPELPDDAVIHIGDSDRGIRRVGEELIADLSGYRFKIALDTPVTRLGSPDSGDFCRFELEPVEEE